MTKVETVVIRERIETVIDAVEEETGHVGVTVIEAVGHGRRARRHARVPRARLRVALPAEGAARSSSSTTTRSKRVVAAIAAAAHSGNESGDGLVWTTPIDNVTHNRTGLRLEEVEVG